MNPYELENSFDLIARIRKLESAGRNFVYNGSGRLTLTFWQRYGNELENLLIEMQENPDRREVWNFYCAQQGIVRNYDVDDAMC